MISLQVDPAAYFTTPVKLTLIKTHTHTWCARWRPVIGREDGFSKRMIIFPFLIFDLGRWSPHRRVYKWGGWTPTWITLMTFAQYHRETLDLDFEVKRHRYSLKGSKWSEINNQGEGRTECWSKVALLKVPSVVSCWTSNQRINMTKFIPNNT